MVQSEDDSSWIIASKNQMCGMNSIESLIEGIIRKHKQGVIIDLEKNEVKFIEEDSDEEDPVMGAEKVIDWSAYNDK